MSVDKKAIVTPNSWASLRRYTDARIGLGRSGVSQPTEPQLEFQQAHARARDAVHIPLDIDQLEQQLSEQGLESLRLHSQATDRAVYLQRPDKGRRLDAQSGALLKQIHERHGEKDATIVIADGLSSTAVQRHAAVVAAAIDRELDAEGLSRTPVCIVQQGRVAVGDEVGELLGSRMVILLVGERPGLSSPDSLGIYYTWNPRVGLTDAYRNCISNIRTAGISAEDATGRLMWLVRESRKRRLSGVALKDESGEADALEGTGRGNFLLD
ncbi:ethanolamine ammonia-lyase subunit EutC [Marinobacterium litorale]|uniref:ethanolamine ammonia-lyase subunit EutC n=1 Tax=Marinobacterium litorale TaxID=404770 RepID=UPI000406F01B|nr:ethanolamine ammonia-lyase subunit EutC [Marinobacterium litorale]